MKVIDLLNKIANGEELPKKIKFQSDIYLPNSVGAYLTKDAEKNFIKRLYYVGDLTTKIEIIEEDKPIEKLSDSCNITTPLTCRFNNIEVKVNEIIDKLNKLEEGK